MIKNGHIGAACAFLDLGFSPEQVKLAFIKQGMPEVEAEYLVKEAIPVGLIGKIMARVGSLFGHAPIGKATQLAASGAGRAVAGGAERAGAGLLARTPNAAANFMKTPGAVQGMTNITPMTGAASGSLTGKLMQGGAASQMAGNALHSVGAAAQHGLAGFQGGGLLGGLKHMGGGALNFGKGMFFMGSKNPSLANMAGKGYGMYGMGSMLLGPGSTPMPSPQQY
jgi:hypothetical protein